MPAKLPALLLCAAALAGAAEIVPPSPSLDRDGLKPFIFRTVNLATGKGELSVEWTDVHGRMVQQFKLPVQLNDETEIGFTLDLRRAVAMRNEVRAHFTFEGVNKRNQPDRRDETAQLTFVARPPDRTWWDYIILMWQQNSAEGFAALKNLGINAAQWSGRTAREPEAMLRNDIRWYAENIATDFYSAYHKFYPDRVNHWAYLQAKELYKKDPTSKESFKRHPSFSDAAWLQKIHERLVGSAKFYAPYRPVFYSLGDETGIADLAAYWDFDFSDQALTEFRGWLKERYPTMADLNRQWGTNFTAWDLVTPDTTNEAMKRADDNFSSWGDFKDFMDSSYARALKMGVDAVHSVDPDAYVGIGGAQMPGWGGYDYWRIANSLSAIEPYDIGNNIEILRSFNPAMPVVTTSFASGNAEKHRVWYELLHGNRGMLIWDDKYAMVNRKGEIGPRGEEVKPYYTEMRRGLGTLLMNSERYADPIAIHYSQASMRTEWLLAQRPKGEKWVDRNSGRERMDSDFLRLRESWCRIVEDQGLQYNFVAYAQVEQGELMKRGYRVLVLPRSSAISAAEARGIREFVAQGGLLIADGVPGVFDEHSRKLSAAQLEDVFRDYPAHAILLQSNDTLNYHQNRLVSKEAPVFEQMGKLLRDAGVRPLYTVRDANGKPVIGVEAQEFRNGAVSIVGLHENPQMRVNELGPPEFKSNKRFEEPKALTMQLPDALYAYDLRAGKSLGRVKQVAFTLDPWEPSIYAFSRVPLPELRVAAPAKLQRGADGRFGLALAGTPAAFHVLHVDVTDPAGKPAAHYSGNLLALGGNASKLLPVAVNDATGKWQVAVRDVLSGQTSTATVEVY